MKKFLPSNYDLVDYDKEILKKQLDLEIVRVTMERDAEREERYCVDKFYSRKVVRMPNEDGMFKRLQLELEQMSQ